MCSHRAASLQLTVSTVASLSKTARPRTKPAKGYQEITPARVKHCATLLESCGARPRINGDTSDPNPPPLAACCGCDPLLQASNPVLPVF